MNIEEVRELYANTIVESYENSDKSRSFELFLADELNAVAASVGTNPKTVILNSRNSGTPTSQNPIGQPDRNNKVHSRNSRTVKGLTNNNPDKNERHGRNIKPSFSDDELDDTEYEGAERCPECGSEDFTQIDTVTRYVHKLIITTKKIKVEYGVFKCNDCGEEFILLQISGCIRASRTGNGLISSF